LLGGGAAYELVVLRRLEKFIKSRTKPPAARRYIDTFVETSLPTLAIVYYMSIVEPFEALLLPPAFVYFVFILLSTLRLDPKLCVFSGIVAATEYGLLALLCRSKIAAGSSASSASTSRPRWWSGCSRRRRTSRASCARSA
jgi:adenylate cyclase